MSEGLTPIVTPEQVAQASGGKISSQDSRLPSLIEGATDGIRLACGWHVTPVITETLTLDGTGGPVMQLPSGLVRDVKEVKVDGVAVDVDADRRARAVVLGAAWSYLGAARSYPFTRGRTLGCF